MKKITILLTVILLTVSLTACNQQSGDTSSSEPESSIQKSVESEEESEQSNKPMTVSDTSYDKQSNDESSEDVFVPPTPTTIVDYQYTVINDKCRLMLYNGTENAVIVPSKAVVDGKEYPTEIGVGCFKNKEITSLSLPDNITEIPDNMCENCKQLSQVKFAKVRSIGKYAFYKCKNFRFQFSELNNGNASVLKKIGEKAFGFSGLYGKVVITSDMDLDIGSFQVCDYISEVEIRPGVTVIPERLFAENCSLEKITLPDSLTKIGFMAFSQNIVKSIEIPKNVKEIGYGMISTYMVLGGKYNGVIIGYKGSAAEEYANKNGIVFSSIE